MPTSVTMPALGESVTEGTVTRWIKQEGEQVEVDEPAQAVEAVEAGADFLLCDNMPPDVLREVVTLVGGRAELEATGGIIIAGIGLRLLELREVKVGSYLPALVVAPVLVALFAS